MAEPIPTPDINDLIAAGARPKSAENETEKATAHSLDEQIKLDKYVRSLAARRKARRGITVSKLVPPGSV